MIPVTRGGKAYRCVVDGERPNPAQWVWYALGGGLPRRLAPWVLADVTRRTWVARHLVRALVQLAPVVVGDRLAGIVSIGDVVKARLDELETEREQLVGYIQTG